MTVDRILAEVKLHIESVNISDVNRHISTALTQLSASGTNTVRSIVVKGGLGTDPTVRTLSQDYNYYTSLKCLILPASLAKLSVIYYNGSPYKLYPIEYLIEDVIPTDGYCVSDTGECYFGIDLEEGSIVKARGMFTVRNVELLSDRYENWILNHVLAGIYSSRPHKDTDMFQLYESRRRVAWEEIRYTTTAKPEWIETDGTI